MTLVYIIRGIAENEALQLKEQLKNNELEKERLKQELEEKNHQIKDLELQLNYVISSKSWKMTEPLRNIRRKFTKKLYKMKRSYYINECKIKR